VHVLGSPRCLISRTCNISLRYVNELVRGLRCSQPLFLVTFNLLLRAVNA
jgi:hypothetical protein